MIEMSTFIAKKIIEKADRSTEEVSRIFRKNRIVQEMERRSRHHFKNRWL